MDRLAEDHDRARQLARGLAELPGIAVDADRVDTNIVIFDVRGTGITGEEFGRRTLERFGVRFSVLGPTLVRAVIHLDVPADARGAGPLGGAGGAPRLTPPPRTRCALEGGRCGRPFPFLRRIHDPKIAAGSSYVALAVGPGAAVSASDPPKEEPCPATSPLAILALLRRRRPVAATAPTRAHGAARTPPAGISRRSPRQPAAPAEAASAPRRSGWRAGWRWRSPTRVPRLRQGRARPLARARAQAPLPAVPRPLRRPGAGGARQGGRRARGRRRYRRRARPPRSRCICPVPAHRAAWSGGEDILVATAREDGEAPVAFDMRGRRRLLDADARPATPVLAVVPVETDFSSDTIGLMLPRASGGGRRRPAAAPHRPPPPRPLHDARPLRAGF